MNESKIKDPRMWVKWRKSGAVGNYQDSYLNPDGLRVEGIAKHHAGAAIGNSVLSLGEKTIAQGKDWKISGPITAVVAPGHDYELGQVIRKYPKGTRTIKEVFGNR